MVYDFPVKQRITERHVRNSLIKWFGSNGYSFIPEYKIPGAKLRIDFLAVSPLNGKIIVGECKLKALSILSHLRQVKKQHKLLGIPWATPTLIYPTNVLTEHQKTRIQDSGVEVIEIDPQIFPEQIIEMLEKKVGKPMEVKVHDYYTNSIADAKLRVKVLEEELNNAKNHVKALEDRFEELQALEMTERKAS